MPSIKHMLVLSNDAKDYKIKPITIDESSFKEPFGELQFGCDADGKQVLFVVHEKMTPKELADYFKEDNFSKFFSNDLLKELIVYRYTAIDLAPDETINSLSKWKEGMLKHEENPFVGTVFEEAPKTMEKIQLMFEADYKANVILDSIS